ncbi:aminobutyraldehyde dehydrogenase [Candidatus Woesearchaeota archaeon]|nr:aminobutyraldehyde dehydrogenase [Candidatus Woesearchaeota archaeon]
MAKQKAKKYQMFIDGKWVDSQSKETLDIVNPATSDVLASVPKGNKEDVNAAVDAARRAFNKGVWSKKTPAERATILWKLADLLEERLLDFATLESMNQGRSIKFSRDADMPVIVDNLRFFAGAARMLEGKAAAEYAGTGTSFVRREPIGVVAGIVPWNYPLLIAVWKLAPALAAGNSIVLKPASYTPLTLLELAKLVQKTGVPDGVVNVLTGTGETVGAALAEHRDVDMISFTGDTSTGKQIMATAAKSVKRVHLELGGKAPCIVLPDADLFTVADGIVTAGFWNSGQDCTAATRVFVPREHHDSVVKKMVELTKKNFRLGSPLKPTTDLGPLVSFRHRERVAGYVKAGMQEGAKVVVGGKQPASREFSRGAFFEPTIMTDAKQHHRICREEIFGPVIAVQTYTDLDQAIKEANDVPYGLSASVWGKDIRACMKVANELQFGTVWINDHGILTSEMPHGGYKQSGFGKDLSLYSLDYYTNIKHVYVDMLGPGEKSWHGAVHKMGK